MREFLQREGHLFLSDRDKGLEAAIKKAFPRGFFRKCFKHIERNIEGNREVQREIRCPNKISTARKWGTLRGCIWAAQRAVTLRDFEARMYSVNRISPAACAYLKGIDERIWTTHALIRDQIALYNKATDNDVEQEMNRFKKLGIRSSLPLQFFQRLARLWNSLLVSAVTVTKYIKEEELELTPYGYSLLKKSIDASARMSSECNGTQTYTTLTSQERMDMGRFSILDKAPEGVMPPSLRLCWETDYETKRCSSGYWCQMNIICAHGHHAAMRLGKTNADWPRSLS